MRFAAPCLLGLEGLVANEFRHNGIENVQSENGRVLFSGGIEDMIKANICSHYADRVMILLSEFNAVTFEELFTGIRNIDWASFISRNDQFPVKGGIINGVLNSVPACQKIIKKAIVEKLKESYPVEWFEEIGNMYKIRFLNFKDRFSIMLDTSGPGLNKRGYRAVSNDAPLKETIAAAMVDLSRVRGNHIVIDPFCGSGTILIESALKAMNIQPGINRSFEFETWPQVDRNICQRIREEFKEQENRDVSFEAYGYDTDEKSLTIAKENARIAGVGDRISFKKRDISDFSDDHEYSTVITNPPYGERMMDIEQARRLYSVMGEKFVKRAHHSYTVISPDESFESVFGRPADKKRKIYNGMIKCNIFMYYRS